MSCLEKIKVDWKKNNVLAVISQEWGSLVGKELSSNCTPLSFKNGVLTIGSSHPQWRQALLYTRSQILESLKSSGFQVKDIRIQQYYPDKKSKLETESRIWEKHPSRVDIHGLKTCESCNKPAPLGEIKRWNKCGFCRRKELS